MKYILIVCLMICGAVYGWAGMNIEGTVSPLTLNGVNWTNIHNIGGKNINWTDIRVYATSFGGDHSNVNWQSLGV